MKKNFILFVLILLSFGTLGCQSIHSKEEVEMMCSMYSNYSSDYKENWYNELIKPLLNVMSNEGYIAKKEDLDKTKELIKNKKDMINAFNIDEILSYEENRIRKIYKEDLKGDSKDFVNNKVNEYTKYIKKDLEMMKYTIDTYEKIVNDIKPNYDYLDRDKEVLKLKSIQNEIHEYIDKNEYIIKD